MKVVVAVYLVVGFIIACTCATHHREKCGFPISKGDFTAIAIFWGPILPLAISDDAIYGSDPNYCSDQ